MRRINHKTIQGLVFGLVLLGASGGGNPVYGQGRPPLSVGTFNTMLWPWMPYEAQVINAIAATDFDVLVLQEVWTKAAQDKIISAVRNKYRFSYVSPARTNEPTIGCLFSEPSGTLLTHASSYINCLIGAGIDTRTLNQPFPAPTPLLCSYDAIQLATFESQPESQQCLAGLWNTMQKLPFDGTSPFQAIPINGARQGPRFTMDGASGQMILSKFPILNVSETRFNSWLYNRVNIYATILNTRFAFVHFGYDVMAADFGGFAIPTYGDTQIHHVTDILAHSPDVVIGDFNSGVDYQPIGYNALMDGGYRDLVPQPFPTFCPPSHFGFQPCINAGSYSASLDHIMVKKNAPGTFRGTFATTPVSDHIGVSATVGGPNR
jgi:endonuclease/exonuclease/phosphatase family metal-dependent hydrolase